MIWMKSDLDDDYILSDEKEFEFLGEDEKKWIDNIFNNDELFYKELFYLSVHEFIEFEEY